MANQTGIIILAAGSSSRMGQPKQLLELEGQNLLQRTIQTSQKVKNTEIVLVLGANKDKILSEISNINISIAFNEEWETGMASSIRKGLQKILEINSSLKAVIILLCDQPFLSSDLINQLIETHIEYPHKMIASEYNQSLGVPVLFPKNYFSELLTLQGQAGAKKIIQKNQKEVIAVPFPKGNIDIDTPEDYEKLIHPHKNIS